MNDIDLEAIRAEFQEFMAAPLRQPTDIDSTQLGLALGIAETTARKRMKEIAAERPDYDLLEVKDGSFTRWVLRRRT